MPKSLIVLLVAGLGFVCAMMFAFGNAAEIHEETVPESAQQQPSGTADRAGDAATPAQSTEIAELRREVSELNALVRELLRKQGDYTPAPVEGTGAPSAENPPALVLDPAVKQAIDHTILDALKRYDETKAEEARIKAEADKREQQEMMKGPYGDNNYSVNSLGKQLGLSDQQKNQYNDLLKWQSDENKKVGEWYQQEDARLQEVYEGYTAKYYASKEYKQLSEDYNKRYSDVSKGVEDGMTRILTSEQYDKWKNQGHGGSWKR